MASSSDKVAGLVYGAGVAPYEGESVNDFQGRFPSLTMDSLVHPLSMSDGTVEVSIDLARFYDVFCADIPAPDAAFMAISQRMVSATAFDDPAAAAAWRTKPSCGRCSAPPITRSLRSSTAFPMTAPARRSRRSKVPPTSS
jgi:hypothetical protein